MFRNLSFFEDFASNDSDHNPDEDKMTEKIRQIFREFNTINALRDALSISLKGSKNVNYREIMRFGAYIIPEVPGDERILFNNKRLNPLYEEYREIAEAYSKESLKEISILEVVDRDITRFENLIKINDKDQSFALRRKLSLLKSLREELEASSHSETNLIIRDVYKVKRGLPFEDGKDYRDFQVTEDRGIRIRVLHPDHLEHITGADLIYECYSETYKKVRLAAIQYKIRRSKSIHIDDRIERQLERLRTTFCDRGMCQDYQQDQSYRLPYCTAFLRPTDEIQSDNPNIISKGYYVPICILRNIREKGELDNPNLIPSKKLRDHAVTHNVFEELFNTDMLGSKWITYDELKAIYTSSNLLEAHQSITFHVQEFTLKNHKNKTRSSRRKTS
jgi:hypothetical protein